MLMWVTAFLITGAFFPPGPRSRYVVLTIVALQLLTAHLIKWSFTLARGARAQRHTRNADRPAMLFVLFVSVAITLWMSAGLARCRHDLVTARNSPSHSVVEKSRSYLLDSLDDPFLTEQSRHMLGALLLADRSNFDRGIKEAYTYLGIAHFLALSGLHLGIIALAVSRCMSVIPIPRSAREFILLAVLAMYAAIAGFPPSLQRALALAAAVIISRAAGVKTDLLGSLVLGNFVLVLFDMSLMLNSGFQLSFTAVSAIALIALPIIKRIDPHLPKGVFGRPWRAVLFSLIVTVSIQFFLLPLMLTLFKRVPLIAPFMNLMFILPVTCLLYLGIPYLCIQYEPVRCALSVPVNFVSRILCEIPLFFSHRPHPAILAGAVDPMTFAAAAALAAFALKHDCRRRRAFLISTIACICLSLGLGNAEQSCSLCERVLPATDAVETSYRPGNACTLLPADDRILVLGKKISRSRARMIVRDLWSRGIGSIAYLVVERGTGGGEPGILHILERVRVREMVCSPYLLLSSNALQIRTRKLGICVKEVSETEVIDSESFVIEIEGPVFPPPIGRAVTARETDLRLRIVSKSP